ncbi:Hydantoinase/oxoprolinase-domain-containing protein [Phakopsora pachyrhizi]|uniref:Hydantoinase/oxoprolinase-domain-containing protein n=1 Tax=Phakopsora pachyrhizi TaxID=170000 RepID=A0AAV0BAC6_PHAPC|nr:Hydantoinase/oxoprolinase-domain-containing protein [Phakopsora pachyrhizi]
MKIRDRSIQISIDRGGTFTDVYASWPESESESESESDQVEKGGKWEREEVIKRLTSDQNIGRRNELVLKLLSNDPSYPDGPWEGTRRVLERILNVDIPRDQRLNTDKIGCIRLSTTVATNALLERKGSKHALLITKGFKDILRIGNQSRPKIFELGIRRPSVLYSQVVEVDERVTLLGYTSDPNYDQTKVRFNEDGQVSLIRRGTSGEAVRIIKTLDEDLVRKDLDILKSQGFESLAIVLMHSYTYPEHEKRIGEIAREIGFKHVSLSSRLMPMIKLVTRGTSSTADAYLTPILKNYIDGFYSGFDDSLRLNEHQDSKTRIEFMRSDGGLTDVENFSGLNSILSGPAGGVVGFVSTIYDRMNRVPVIGLDMGGTSTDVSRYDGHYETVFESTTAGVTIQSPQLDINTVAAGGGSRLFWRNGLFVTGPESAGASPGPACYRKGGPLTVTDANLVLGRLVPRYFPKIFGPSQDQGLDYDASLKLFEKLAVEISSDVGKNMTVDEIAWGFIKIANETMCRPIRALTEARGYNTSKHILTTFGGAGGQHACALARTLNIRSVIIHKHSSILSAYGMALANRVIESQMPCAMTYEQGNTKTRAELEESLSRLEKEVREKLRSQGFENNRIEVERYLNLRYEGTDTTLMIMEDLNPSEGSKKDDDKFDYSKAFENTYKQQFGFVLDDSKIVCDDLRVRGIGKSFGDKNEPLSEELRRTRFKKLDNFKDRSNEDKEEFGSIYFEGFGRINDVPILKLGRMKLGDEFIGPALLIDDTQTIVIDPNVNVKILTNHIVIAI